ncbi:MAG: endonuclease III [Clostridia bacterium]|nr:endonuclease III [Clostridia bacterium]
MSKKSPEKKEDRSRGLLTATELQKLYPGAQCSLEWREPWQLLIMGRLSAQCTDARVNIVCRELFLKYPTPESVADADIGELEEAVKPCGLYRTKAASIKAACRMLIDDFGGVLPRTMDELLLLPGVGRKIANLLLGDVYGIPGVVADTHCIRICGRLGFYPETLKDPLRVEKILSEEIPAEYQTDTCHRLVDFGRDICRARQPECDRCPEKLKSICTHFGKTDK